MKRPSGWIAVLPPLLAMAVAGNISCRGRADGPELRPNILLFLADDHGQWAAGPYGGHGFDTPTLDRLSETGLLLANATSPSPVCSPARTSLLTGRLPSQHGVHDFLSERPAYDRGWLDGEVLLPELLQGAGYRTALIGKWHCTATSHQPFRGFDRWLSYDVRPDGWRNQYRKEGPVHLSDQGRPVTVEGYQLEHLGAAAREFIESGDGTRPFFLLFAPTDTHGPYRGNPEGLVVRYRQVPFTGVPRQESSALPAANAASVAPLDLTEVLAQYAAAVTRQDAELGRMLELLAARGELDDTLVVYTSDHGLMVGHHGLIGKSNATLPQNLYEDSIRVPMVLAWPRGLPQGGRVLDLPFDHLDLFRTILDAARVELGEDLERHIESPGQSLLAKLADADVGWRRFRYSEHGNARSISDGHLKLVCRYPPRDPRFGDELYDLEHDPRETVNRIDDPEDQSAGDELRRALQDHFRRYEVAGKRGVDALEQPPMNGVEPWRRTVGGPASRPE